MRRSRKRRGKEEEEKRKREGRLWETHRGIHDAVLLPVQSPPTAYYRTQSVIGWENSAAPRSCLVSARDIPCENDTSDCICTAVNTMNEYWYEDRNMLETCWITLEMYIDSSCRCAVMHNRHRVRLPAPLLILVFLLQSTQVPRQLPTENSTAFSQQSFYWFY